MEKLGDKRDKIKEIVRNEGPLLPAFIGRKLGIDLTFAAAMLSEMVDNKALLLTNVKCGGSPFYYLQGQEEKLQELTKYLNEKDRETSELLKEKKVLRDIDLSPLQRVSLRQIKDYAKQVQVRLEGRDEIFWRWYLTNEEETKRLITEYLQSSIKEEVKPQEIKQEESKEEIHEPAFVQEQSFQLPETQKTLEEEPKFEEVHEEVAQEEISNNSEDPLGKFLIENNFEVLKQDIIRKNKEINYLVELDIKVGKATFFLKYKDKKRVNESDIALAKHEAGDLPLFFLSTGELTKKTEEMLKKEFRGTIFRKL